MRRDADRVPSLFLCPRGTPGVTPAPSEAAGPCRWDVPSVPSPLPMRRPLALAALLALAPAALAQTDRPAPGVPPEASGGFDALDEEVRALGVPLDLYLTQLGEAWDRALVAQRYGRADSVAALAEQAILDTQGTSDEATIWPSAADRLALGLLAGDFWAVEWLREDGAWWETPTTAVLYSGDVWVVPALSRAYIPRRFEVRRATANVLARDSAQVAGRLAGAGATPEMVAVARLAIGKVLAPPNWNVGGRDPELTPAQEALNDRVDAFLARFPGSAYERFVREEIRLRYRARGAISLFLGLGGGGATGNLDAITGPSIAGDIGIGVRYGFGHAEFGLFGSDLSIQETVVARNGDDLVDGDRLSFALLGVSVGPRLPLAGLDVLPHVSGGLLLQGVSAPGEDEFALSTYDPPVRPGWGYGIALEYVPTRASRYGAIGYRVRATRLFPDLDGFEGALDGPVTSITAGVSLTGILRERVR